jgi:DNA (cytosine-5)-methyltransferase 1
MKYLSLCSGIEAATVAWHPLGWEAVAYSEIERFPSEVLAHHYPSTPNLGDMTKFKEWNLEQSIGLLVGGTPCQSFSVAGLRKGLDDPRGNLMLTYLAIADKYKPQWIVWENVPGVLSSNGGKDFGVFLGALGELGYGFAYRVLDAQYFGVAQRRRRVFVVGYLGDWRPAAAVLFERYSLSGHPAPSREKREEVAGTIAARFGISRNNHEECVTSRAKGFYESGFAQYQQANVGGTIKASGGVLGGGSETFLTQPSYGIPGNWIGRKPENGGNATEPMYDIAPCLTKTDQHGVAQPIAFTTEQTPKYNHDQALTLTKSESKHNQCVAAPIAFSGCDDGMDTQINVTPTMRVAGNAQGNLAVAVGTDLYNGAITGDVAATMSTAGSTSSKTGPTVMQPMPFGVSEKPDVGHCLRSGASKADKHESTTYVAQSMAVRRLTPVECERLQGFPDSYTDIKSKNKPTPDGPRYKALGNSMAVPVMAWIGQRIEQVEAICKQNK